MLTLYGFSNKKLMVIPEKSDITPIWIDCSGLRPDNLKEIEKRKNFFETLGLSFQKINGHITALKSTGSVLEDDILYSKIILSGPTRSHYQPLYVILTKNVLLTFRERTTVLYDETFHIKQEFSSPFDILLGIVSELMQRSIETLTRLEGITDELNLTLFQDQNIPPYNHILTQSIMKIGKTSQSVMKTQQSLETFISLLDNLSSDNTLNVFITKKEKSIYLKKIENLHTELDELQNFSGFIIQNLSYLSDASIGMVSINQNTLMTYLSILATVLIPPSLVVSLFAIQFNDIPPMNWMVGIPLIVGLMALSSFVSYKILQKQQKQ